MRWSGQELTTEQAGALPGLARLNNLVRSVRTPEFDGITFHEVLAKSALNRVPGQSAMPFGWTINPYRGCSHACTYCLSPETLILMADGRQKPLWEVRVGEAIIGTRTEGVYRRYIETTVLAAWNTRKRGYRITLGDGTEIVASGDHRFLTERGWKYVTGAMSGADQRPYLTPNNKLTGFGLNGLTETTQPQYFKPDYRRGYLTGMIRGDGMMISRDYPRRSGGGSKVRLFRLALADVEALNRSRLFLEQEGVLTQTRPFAVASGTRRAMASIYSGKAANYERITKLIQWPEAPDADWHAGYLSGVFDAEGSCSQGVLRISNMNVEILDNIQTSMAALGIDHVLEAARRNGVRCVRVTGGLPMRSRFFNLVGPAIDRKLSIAGRAVKSDAKLQIVSIEDLGATMDMIDITTGTGDFVANGVVSHNCFARPTHNYLDLDAGKDFDNEIIVKVNVAEILRKELAKPTWGKHPVALGTNTDPYQRAEGRYRLMPGIIAALADSGTPFSILTKGTLLRRDLDLLREASRQVPVDLAMSIAIYDDELQQAVEPGTPSTKARLATVSAIRNLGMDCSVFLMPILPFLTDTRAHLDEAMRQAKAAGATGVLYSALYLKPGVKEWYFQWLERDHPELLPRYREMFKRGSYAPKEYRQWLAGRIQPLMRAHGLSHRREDPATGGILSTALTGAPVGPTTGADGPPAGSLIAAELPPEISPTLF
ncbi:intein-containing Rv2578c family radical SAM protein [Cryobacterium sp.]|uniref:intein-containing Rv2578c family radical SAM protein n=1 Tax=Cryobacterium sp. TaxID=1926290 RepID=UPI00260F712A|nr:intein-containing Rv2578c family radical SAM protein [Cryobacterium sp.]MCU1446977.1 repair photolyase [Cryobacterium sp.]